MSYRNPQQNVDTQSGQAFANLQRTIAGTFGGIVQQELATQKELAKKQAELAKKRERELKEYNIQEANVALGLKKIEVDNPALNIGESFGPLVDKYSDIMTQINSGSITDPKEVARLRSEAADILTLPQRVGNMLEGLSIVDQNIEATQDRMGKMGGLDPGTPGDMYENMQVLMNKKPGKRETNIEYKNGKYVTNIVITPEGGEPTSYTEDQIRKYASGESEGVIIIPDETKDMENLVDTHINMKNSTTGKIMPRPEIYGEKTTRRFENKDTGEVTVETYRPLRREFLKLNANAVIEANIKAMSINEKIGFMNNIVSPGNRMYDSENILNADSQKALIEGYGDYWLKNFTTGDQVLSTQVIKPEKPEKISKKDVAKSKSYKIAKKVIESSTDDLNFGAKGYDTESQYDKIEEFAGREELGVKVEKVLDDDGKVQKIIVKSLNNPRQEYVIGKGFSDEKVKGILLKAAEGSYTAEDTGYEGLSDEEKFKKLMKQYNQ